MTEETPFGDPTIPEELRELDAELSAIRYEERPSFAPELRAELSRAWTEAPPRRSYPFVRHLMAAGIAALLVGGASVPSARASFVRFIGALNGDPVVVPVAPVVVMTPAEAMVPDGRSAPMAEESDVVLAAMQPEMVAIAAAPEVVAPALIIKPSIVDRDASRRLLEAVYPSHLQRRGVGGTVLVRLWIDEAGSASAAELRESSGVDALDRAAVRAAPDLDFTPATENGEPIGTWIEFPVQFVPDPELIERELQPAVDPLSLPTVAEGDWWQLREPLELSTLPESGTHLTDDTRARNAAAQSLAAVFAGTDVVAEYGPVTAMLEGEAPVGSSPWSWHAEMGDLFETAVEEGAADPATMLAFGRIRLRQGLRTEARSLFEQGLQMTKEIHTEPWVVAELHYERASIIRDRWLASDGVGRVLATSFEGSECRQANSSGGAATGYSSVNRLLAWNYLCPEAFAGVLDEGFEPLSRGSAGDLTLMMASLRAAVEAYPAHVEANTDLLVTLADGERWDDVLSGARRFTRVAGGHPTGLLLAGLALHRLDQSVEAAEHFRAALERVGDGLADELSDVSFLLDGDEAAWYQGIAPGERRVWEISFWRERDRVPATVVNERWVEHMARTAYAKLRFGEVFGDAGEVWVRFGGPNRIHVVDEGSGRLTEFWDYGRGGPDITFVRWASSKRTDLTPEGRAYVDDLRRIFPPQ